MASPLTVRVIETGSEPRGPCLKGFFKEFLFKNHSKQELKLDYNFTGFFTEILIKHNCHEELVRSL